MSTPSRVFNKFNRFNKLNRFNRFNCTVSTAHPGRIVAPLPTVCIPLHPLGAKHMEPKGAKRSQKEPKGARTAQSLQSLFPHWLAVMLLGTLVVTQTVTLAGRHPPTLVVALVVALAEQHSGLSSHSLLGMLAARPSD